MGSELTREEFHSTSQHQTEAIVEAIKDLGVVMREVQRTSYAAQAQGVAPSGNGHSRAMFGTCITLIFSIATILMVSISGMGDRLDQERDDRIARDNHNEVASKTDLDDRIQEQALQLARLERYNDEMIRALYRKWAEKNAAL